MKLQVIIVMMDRVCQAILSSKVVGLINGLFSLSYLFQVENVKAKIRETNIFVGICFHYMLLMTYDILCSELKAQDQVRLSA